MSSRIERLVFGFVTTVLRKGLKGKVLIDLGCGFGRWGHLIRSCVDEGGHEVWMIGCDIFRPYLEITKKYNPYDNLILCDVRFLPFRECSVDIGLMFELIEHLDKREGYKLLTDLLKICKERIFVSTPARWYPQNAIHQNEFERHRSFWTKKEFEKMGFIVREYGFGIILENILRRLHLFRLVNLFHSLIYRTTWGGIMLVAEKRL